MGSLQIYINGYNDLFHRIAQEHALKENAIKIIINKKQLDLGTYL